MTFFQKESKGDNWLSVGIDYINLDLCSMIRRDKEKLTTSIYFGEMNYILTSVDLHAFEGVNKVLRYKLYGEDYETK